MTQRFLKFETAQMQQTGHTTRWKCYFMWSLADNAHSYFISVYSENILTSSLFTTSNHQDTVGAYNNTQMMNVDLYLYICLYNFGIF